MNNGFSCSRSGVVTVAEAQAGHLRPREDPLHPLVRHHHDAAVAVRQQQHAPARHRQRVLEPPGREGAVPGAQVQQRKLNLKAKVESGL
jgi:hypothetical protein